MLSVPALPLMQLAVSSAGPAAMESVSKYCIAGMSVGQGIGPVLGGIAMQHFGFSATASTGAFLFIVWVIFSTSSKMPPGVDALVQISPPSEPPTPTRIGLDRIPMALDAQYAVHWTPAVQAAKRSRWQRSMTV